MEFLIIGIVVAANITIIIMKFKRARYEDAVLDSVLLAIVTVVFMGSYGGLVVATVASFLISLYLLASPPKIGKLQLKGTPNISEFFHEFKRRAQPRYL